MKRNAVIIIVLAAVVLGFVSWGGYTWNRKRNTPPRPVSYENMAELVGDIQRLEALKISKGLTWQDTYRLAVAYIQRGEAKEAVPLLEDAARRRPGFSKIYESLGMAYYRQGIPDKAIEAWDKALKADPKAEFLKGMIDRAKTRQEILKRVSALELESKAADAGWEKRFELAALYLSVNRVVDARAELDKVVSVKKDSSQVYDAIAEANALSGDFEKAIEAEKKALRLDPKNEVLKKRLSEMERVGKGIKEGQNHRDGLPDVTPVAPNQTR